MKLAELPEKVLTLLLNYKELDLINLNIEAAKAKINLLEADKDLSLTDDEKQRLEIQIKKMNEELRILEIEKKKLGK